MTCSRFGCDEEVTSDGHGKGMECPVHGSVLPILHDNLIDKRWAQARIEIERMAKGQHERV